MTTLTRDDTIHDVEYVTKHEAQMEIDAAKHRGMIAAATLQNELTALKADTDALANACKLCASVIGPPDNVEWSPIPDCDAAYAAADAALQSYHAKYPAP